MQHKLMIKSSKQMKPIVWILAICLALIGGYGSLQAQSERHPSREQIAQAKRTFLVEQLQLTQAESTALMPILEELDEQRFKLWQELRRMSQRIHRGDSTLSDDELRLHLDRLLDNRVREAELERIYYKKCCNILSPRKVALLEHLNRRFARHYFKKGRMHKAARTAPKGSQ